MRTPTCNVLAAVILILGAAGSHAQDHGQPNHPDFRGKDVRCPQGYRLHYQGMCVNSADEKAGKPKIRGAEPQIKNKPQQ